jgi:isopenicillin N synthase-like dioxygenase
VQKLSCNAFNAYRSLGFFYITNFGLSQEEVDQQFSIGEQIFKLPIEEKLKFRAELEKGGYNGYKPMGLRVGRKSTTRPENRNL